MRVFITFEFSYEAKKHIADIQNIIKKYSNRGRFKYYDNFHLTLKFLGETDNAMVDTIYDELSKWSNEFSKVNIKLKGIDKFGFGENIKTIYLKAYGEVEKIVHIANKVDEITCKLGFKGDNRFVPHVTIAQDVDLNISFEELKQKLKDIEIPDVVFDKIVIMKSEELNKKRIYTPLKTIYLK